METSGYQNGGYTQLRDGGVDARAGGGRIVVKELNVGPLYEASNGRFYTDWQVGQKMRSGEWKPCLWEEETGQQLVGTADGELLMLVSMATDDLPDWAEIRSDTAGSRIVDTRRALP